MKVRGSLIVAAAALIALTACGSTTQESSEVSATSTSSAIAAPPPVTDTPTVETKTVTVVETATADPTTSDVQACPGPPRRGTGASAFEGSWQRHASQLVLQRDTSTSTLTTGASAVDTENWRVDWTQDECDSNEIIVTLLDRTALYGSGVDGDLFQGKTFRATFGTGPDYTTTLVTSGVGDAPGVYTWCRSGESAPECGA
ncbi:hypothetical protein ACNHUS_22590 [Actinomycetes bacterium M1A6_2h]